jgi:hypothetical protein
MADQSSTRASYPSVVALVVAQTQKRIAELYRDNDLAKHAEILEYRALAAIQGGQTDLPPIH